MTVTNPLQFIGSSSTESELDVEGPPTVDISLVLKDAGNPCSRENYAIFNWSEPVDFLGAIIFQSVADKSISLGTSLPGSPATDSIFIATSSIASISIRDKDGCIVLNSAQRGDVLQHDGSKWIRRGNLTEISVISSLGPNITSGTVLPTTGVSSNDIFIFTSDVPSGLLNYEDINGDEATEAVKGDIAQFGGSTWNQRGRVGIGNITIAHEDRDKAELVSGTLTVNSLSTWVAEVNIKDTKRTGNFTIGVNSSSVTGRLSGDDGPPDDNRRFKTFDYDYTDCLHPSLSIEIQPDNEQDLDTLPNITDVGNINIGIDYPEDPSDDDILIFSSDIESGLSHRDTDGTTVIDSADEDDVIQYTGTAWIKRGNLNDIRDYNQDKYDVFFNWNEPVSDFNDIWDVGIKKSGATDLLNAVDSVSSSPSDIEISVPEKHEGNEVYRSDLVIPNNHNSTFEIVVKRFAAEGVYNRGPIKDKSKKINADNRLSYTCAVVGADSSQSIEFDIDALPYLNGIIINSSGVTSDSNIAGGVFNCVLEQQEVGDRYVFIVVQILKQLEGHIRAGEQAGAALLKVDTTMTGNAAWTLIKSYNNVLTCPRSLCALTVNGNDYLYFVEGSHYSYLPQAEFRNADFSIPRRINLQDSVRSVQDIVLASTPDRYGATLFGPSPAELRKAASLIETRINNAIARDLPNLEIYVELVKYILPLLLEEENESVIIAEVKRRLTTFLIPGYTEDWKGEIGNFCRIINTGGADDLEVIGTNWRSATTEDNPEHDDENPDYFYGIHGGVISPCVLDSDDDIHFISGYGDLSNLRKFNSIDSVNSPINNIDNWQRIQYSDKINHKLSLLLTNERSPYDVISDIANITNSIFGFDVDNFFIIPRAARSAELNNVLLSNASSITLKANSYSWDPAIYPESGMVLINNELLSYGNSSDPPNGYTYNSSDGTAILSDGILRGLHGTTEVDHSDNSEVIWIDHFISLDMQVMQKPIQSIDITSQSEHLFNHILVKYGDGKEFEVDDPDSIALNRRQTHEVNTSLDDHQYQWAKWIGKDYLKRFKDIHHIINLDLKTTLYMKVGEIVLIDQQDRAYLFTPCQILNISHTPQERVTRLKLVTL